jgi:hypothetical protein
VYGLSLAELLRFLLPSDFRDGAVEVRSRMSSSA